MSKSNKIEELFLTAEQALQTSDFVNAENLYQQILDIIPDNPDALNYLGIVCFQQKKYQQAGQLFKQLLELNPDYPDANYNLANILKLTGDYTEAAFFCRIAIEQDLGLADNYNVLASIMKLSGNFPEAIVNYQTAIKLEPGNFNYYYNLAILQKEQADFPGAKASYLKAVQLNPGFTQAFYNLANLLAEQNETEEAESYFNKVLEINPAFYKAHYSLAYLLQQKGNPEKATEHFQKTIQLNPNHAEAYFFLGNIMAENNKIEPALELYNKAISINNNFEKAHCNLGFAYETLGQTEKARECFKAALLISPGNKFLKLHIEALLPVIPYDNHEIDQSRKHLLKVLNEFSFAQNEIELVNLQSYNIPPSSELNYQGRDDRLIKEKYAALFKDHFPKKAKSLSKGKPKIGFVVTRGHEVLFIKCMKGILNNLPGEKFDLNILFNNPNSEPLFKQSVTNPAFNFSYFPRQLDQAVNVIGKGDFDILYFWEVGSDITNYFLPFFRLAPIQCTSWGWPVTSGIPEMDYFISSELLETTESENFYSEKLYCLKSLPPYYYRSDAPAEIKPLSYFGLSEDKNIYLCVQNFRKVHPDFDQLIAKILRTDAKGIVVFSQSRQPGITESLKNRLKRKFPGLTDRIKFISPPANYDDFLSLLANSSVSLDTLHYSGANTTYESFAVGLPVVTLPGRFHRGRYTFAAYQEMGMIDCIANDEKDYVEIAVKLGTNPDYRKEISEKIKKLCPVLFENINAVKELTGFFEYALEELKNRESIPTETNNN